MIKTRNRLLSGLLAFLLIAGLFTAVPITVSAATAKYVKVTEAPADWSGTYLIVYEGGNKAFKGSLSGSDLQSANNFVTVTISNGEIESNADTDAAKVAIAACDGGYSIQTTGDDSYIGGVSGSNLLTRSSTAIANTISISDGNAHIVSNTSVLRFNTGWPGFRYYKSSSYTNQQAIQLYKLTEASAPETYTITWKNWDDTTLETDENVAIGATPSYDGSDPTKEADAQYTYVFSGWDTEPVAVTGDATYTATFTANVNEYTITWKLDADTVIDTTSVAYGTVPTHADPTKAADAQNTYVFAGWDTTPVAVTGEATYTATFTANVNEYTITWKLDADTVIDTTSVAYGTVPTHADPTKAADDEYTYTFAGWDTEPVAVTGEATYTAVFTPEPKVHTYTVTWNNWNGDALEIDTGVAAGETPVYNGAEPTKDADATRSYVFAGWTPEIEEVTGDITYTATFMAVYPVNVKTLTGTTYTVYISSDMTVPQLKEAVAVETGIPAASQRLIFAGKQLANDKTVADYNIQKGNTVHLVLVSYTITWKLDEDTVIDTTSVRYGEVPTHEDAVKADDDEYTYEFAGWTPEIVAVTGEATYTATFNAIEKSIFSGHSISLNGDVDVNFYLNLTDEQVTEGEGVVVTYTWAHGTASHTVSASDFVDGRGFKTIAKLPAAEMNYSVTATVTIDGVEQTETNTYSVRDYALAVIADPSSSETLVTLMKTMLDYGAKAQDAFGRTDVAYANEGVDYTMGAVSTDMIDDAIAAANVGETSDNLTDVASLFGAKYYTSSLVFLYECTLRHYFVPNGGALDASLFDGVKSGHYYYVEQTDIAAADLDSMQTFTVGGVTFKYSALDFVKAIMAACPVGSAQYNLAAATYWYNQAANAHFG